MSADVVREIPMSEAQVVDSCFEEDAYQSGISLLNQMRATDTKPRSDHVRVLVLLALYPPALHKAKKAPEKGLPVKKPGRGRKKANVDDGTEMQAPLASECAAALTLLHSYTQTVHPVHILRALPGHKHLEGYVAPLLDPDMHDSAVAKRSLILARKQECPDVWAMLREGFIPDPTGRDIEMSQDESGQEDVPPVGRRAWLVLEWLVSAFEEDERRRKASSSKDEPLFLAQLPQARANGATKGPLWDCRKPVTVALYCFTAEGEFPLSQHERQDLGRRLMRIMVNLSTTTSSEGPFPFLDPTNLVRSVSRPVRSLPPEAFDAFFRTIAQDAPIFVVSVLFLYLATAASISTAGLFGGDGAQIVRPYIRPRLSAISTLMAPKQTAVGNTDAYRRNMLAKVHMLRAGVRSLHIGQAADDVEWRGAARAGTLQAAIRKAFAPEPGMMSPPGKPVDKELAKDAAMYCESVILLMNTLVA
ncbi:hypothetical protein EXIGLDRAFT_841148 [Exidia glandulosa HHB12029]|uniref:Uncharacterized protein n=1 Tax=Exidia glandulosa HHB12029 TaxID=1314781 RepID=A0A165E1D9_EXIGL|nr:hypothetical protein EXIGLDRAFT_841148 [Exidia glandulosa HHB12029]